MIQGKIVKGIAGFYYVYGHDNQVYECRARGILRNRKQKPLVGDNILFEIIDKETKVGNVVEILPRKNELIRPAVANVDQALVVFAAKEPEPNFNLLDRFLILMERDLVPVKICFNKLDIVEEHELELLQKTYIQCGYEVIVTSAKQCRGIDVTRALLENKTTVLAGPSGVGKSTLLNLLQPNAQMETGEISEKIKRGKHTTRHSELIRIEKDTYLMDTPGFSSLYLLDMDKEALKHHYIEFAQYTSQCRFTGCSHINEPDCGVKEAVKNGNISKYRYESYEMLYNDLKDQRRW